MYDYAQVRTYNMRIDLPHPPVLLALWAALGANISCHAIAAIPRKLYTRAGGRFYYVLFRRPVMPCRCHGGCKESAQNPPRPQSLHGLFLLMLVPVRQSQNDTTD